MKIGLEGIASMGVIASQNDVVHIYKQSHEGITLSVGKERIICIGVHKPIFSKLSRELSKPLAWCLSKPIKEFLKSTHLIET